MTSFCGLKAQIDSHLNTRIREKLDSVIESERAAQQIIGMAVTIVHDGQISMVKGYGYADWEKLHPVTPETIFRWASISKTLTAITAFKLREEGLLHLDSSAMFYLPGLKFKGVKVSHLLQNRSGLGHYNEMNKSYPEWKTRMLLYPKPDTIEVQTAIDIFRDAPLEFTPGEKNLYSTFGFVTAGAVLDHIGQRHLRKNYPELVEEYIARPLGMSTLQPELYNHPSSLESKGYYLDDEGEVQVRKNDDIRWKLPGGGFHSSIQDLGHYISGLMTGKILSPESYTLLWTKQHDANYGYGFDIKGDGTSSRSVGHSGAQAETRTVFMIYPAHKIGIGVMCNSEWASPERMAHLIARALGIQVEPEVFDPACHEYGEYSPNTYLSIIQAGQSQQLIRKAYPLQQFKAEVTHLARLGYRLQNASSYLDKKNVRHWDGTFSVGQAETQFFAHQTLDSFTTLLRTQAAQGFQLVNMTTYIADGARMWAGVFRQNGQRTTLIQNLTESQFNKKFQEFTRKGQMLIDFKNYWDSNNSYWAGLFVEGKQSQTLLRNLSMEEFWKRDQMLIKQGLQLIDIEVNTLNAQPLWSGVWQAENRARQAVLDRQYCSFQKRCQGLNAQGQLIVQWVRL